MIFDNKGPYQTARMVLSVCKGYMIIFSWNDVFIIIIIIIFSLKNPCILNNDKCAPSYGYIHRQKLNSDINKFIVSVIRMISIFVDFIDV